MTDPDEEPDPRTVVALADAARLTGTSCQECAATLCGHAAVFALVLGYKSAPRCLPCTARHMNEPVADLRERTLTYVQHHACFLAAWRRAGELERSVDAERPECVWHANPAGTHRARVAPTAMPAAPGDATAARWDAGAMGCGDLLLELRLRLAALPPGAIFELRAEDPGAPIDMPAWCNVTGHALIEALHPEYRIRRKA